MLNLNWAEVGPVVAHVDGFVRAFETLEAAVRYHLPRITCIVGAYRDGYVCPDGNRLQNDHFPAPWAIHGPANVAILDESGIPVPVWRVAQAYDDVDLAMRERYASLGRRWRRFEFRRGPVEGIRCSRGGRSYYRRMKTTAEARAADGHEHDSELIEAGVRVRPRRNATNLPTSWDDRYAHPIHNWKKQRRTQWR